MNTALAIPVLCLLATAALADSLAVATATTASGFAILSAADGGGGAVSCTDSTITGDAGSSGLAASVIQAGCTISAAPMAPVPGGVLNDFNDAYDALAAVPCDENLPATLAGGTLTPGVYCFDAAAGLTGSLMLAGPGNGIWIFKVGAGGAGALMGIDLSVVMADGAPPCNVYWWVANGVTINNSNFKGTILAGAGIILSGGTFAGRALAKAAVTLNGSAATGCAGDTTTYWANN